MITSITGAISTLSGARIAVEQPRSTPIRPAPPLHDVLAEDLLATGVHYQQCSLGKGYSCAVLGSRYASGYTLEKNTTAALHYFVQGCALSNGTACAGAAGIYIRRDLPGLSNISRANFYYGRGCYHNNGYACFGLGVSYQQGNGIRPNHYIAALYYAKGCRLNDGLACNSLGVCYRSGLGVAANSDLARAAYDKSCLLGNPIGCQNLQLLELSR